MGDKNQNTNENLLKRLADFIEEGHVQGAEEERLNDEIAAAGIDPAAYMSKGQAFLDTAIKERRQALHAQRISVTAKLEALIAKWKERTRQWSAQDEATWTAKLEPRLAAAYFRNFKSTSAADKASMMEDLELLEKLVELANDQEEKK